MVGTEFAKVLGTYYYVLDARNGTDHPLFRPRTPRRSLDSEDKFGAVGARKNILHT